MVIDCVICTAGEFLDGHHVVNNKNNVLRLAVTVWYLDETEKRVYERRKQEAAAAAALQNVHNPR